MLVRRLALPLIACLIFGAGCSAAIDEEQPVDVDEGQDALTANDQAVIDLVAQAKKTVYANVDGRAPKELAAALIAAAKRGVDVHVLITINSHDTTWLLQQRLESSGVDADV